MRPGRILLVPAILLTLVAARPRAVSPPEGWVGHAAPADVFSYAEPAKVTTRSIALDLAVDFEGRQLRGSARLEIENLTGTDTLILDTESLTISSVVLDDAVPAQWSFGQTSSWGTPLRITIGPATRSVTIAYETSPTASGLLWNTAMLRGPQAKAMPPAVRRAMTSRDCMDRRTGVGKAACCESARGMGAASRHASEGRAV